MNHVKNNLKQNIFDQTILNGLINFAHVMEIAFFYLYSNSHVNKDIIINSSRYTLHQKKVTFSSSTFLRDPRLGSVTLYQCILAALVAVHDVLIVKEGT